MSCGGVGRGKGGVEDLEMLTHWLAGPQSPLQTSSTRLRQRTLSKSEHSENPTFLQGRNCMQARRLPLAEHLTFTGTGSRNAKWKVLNIDSVVHALLEFKSTADWKHAFDAAVPKRKMRLK
jgi:hypothetical protein